MTEEDTEEFIRRLRGQLTGMRVLVYALLDSHPQPEAVLEKTKLFSEQLRANLLASTIPDFERQEFDQTILVGERILSRSA